VSAGNAGASDKSFLVLCSAAFGVRLGTQWNGSLISISNVCRSTIAEAPEIAGSVAGTLIEVQAAHQP